MTWIIAVEENGWATPATYLGHVLTAAHEGEARSLAAHFPPTANAVPVELAAEPGDEHATMSYAAWCCLTYHDPEVEGTTAAEGRHDPGYRMAELLQQLTRAEP
jgi:hypothetical protein